MNPHDDIPDDGKDEEQIASVLKASETSAAPPDLDLLARLRTQSTEAFSAASAQPAPTGARQRPTFLRKARWLGAAAAIVVAGVGLYFWLAPGRSGVALGQVLDNVEKADTLHVRFSLGDKQVEYWQTSKPKRSRWDNLDGKYMIADGPEFWMVNERINEARRAQPPDFAGRPIHHFLKLLGVPDGQPAILAARP